MTCSIDVTVTNPKTGENEVWELEAEVAPEVAQTFWDTASGGEIEFLTLTKDGVTVDYQDFMCDYVVNGSEIDAWYELLAKDAQRRRYPD